MDQSIKEKIGQSVTEVFSTMYFIPIELLGAIPNKEKWNLDSTYISAKIHFTGPLSANICFYFPGSLVHNIAEGFLGVAPEDISEKQAMDVMQEAANMVIGSFLGKADPDGACKLGIPKAEFITDFSPEKLSQETELLSFLSEFGYMWVTYNG